MADIDIDAIRKRFEVDGLELWEYGDMYRYIEQAGIDIRALLDAYEAKCSSLLNADALGEAAFKQLEEAKRAYEAEQARVDAAEADADQFYAAWLKGDDIVTAANNHRAAVAVRRRPS